MNTIANVFGALVCALGDMELVMRVLVEAKDEDIAKWAKEDEVDTDQMITRLKEEAEEYVKKAERLVNLASAVSFIEWEPEGCYPTYHKDVE